MSAYRLTANQQSYADNRIKGMEPREALINSTYSTDNYSKNALSVQANKLENHPNIRLKIEAGRERAAKKVEYTLERALEMAIEDRDQAKELGQIGAAVSSNKLAAQLMGYLIERQRNVDKEPDPVQKLLETLGNRGARKTPTHDESDTQH